MHLIFVLKLQLLIFSSPRAAEQWKLSPRCHRGAMLPEPHSRVPLGWGWWRIGTGGASICMEEEYLFLPQYPCKESFKLHLKMK